MVSLSLLSAFRWLLQQIHHCIEPIVAATTQMMKRGQLSPFSSSKTRLDSDVITNVNSVYLIQRLQMCLLMQGTVEKVGSMMR